LFPPVTLRICGETKNSNSGAIDLKAALYQCDDQQGRDGGRWNFLSSKCKRNQNIPDVDKFGVKAPFVDERAELKLADVRAGQQDRSNVHVWTS
jgi:hypothetical protein